MIKIKIEERGKKVELPVELLNNPTSEKITHSLPITSSVNTWGDEICFDTNVTASSEGATLNVKAGDIAYWPEGRCLCIFFGKTPASRDTKPVLASKVVAAPTGAGKTEADLNILRKIRPGAKITVE